MSTQYGWRARVGHISPALLDTSAEECRKLLPPGVLHVGLSISQPVQRMAPDELDQAGRLMVDAARRLAAEEVDVIVAGGAPATARQGPAADDALLGALREASGLPCTTANRAVVEALDALGLRLPRNVDIARQSAATPYQMARALVRETPDVDGVYIACPRWSVVDIVE